MHDVLEVLPVSGPVHGTIRPPGSKSITNRALVTAALARGDSRLTGVLDSQDTRVMLDSLQRLGLALRHDPATAVVTITGCAGRPPVASAELWLENSGTSIRFLTALCCLGQGEYRLDGNARMRERPLGDLIDALNQLGAHTRCQLNNRCPPVQVDAQGLPGGLARVASGISSQYLSALLMAAPGAEREVTLEVAGELVSEPYVDMTIGVMRAFGVDVGRPKPGVYTIAPQTYRGTPYDIEPDASAASYFFALAAVTGGRVTVQGLTHDALQGDVKFVDVLARMGCRVETSAEGITLTGGPLRGIEVDMNAISDTAQTLAAVAPFAVGPTTIRNIPHVRHKETDRIAAARAKK
jgi:3-phosphoshikimate 1-carboxyvinyltransferase